MGLLSDHIHVNSGMQWYNRYHPGSFKVTTVDGIRQQTSLTLREASDLENLLTRTS